MTGKILVSTAYLPPVPYFSLINKADEVLIEKEENYIKQTYRNRCYILSANGIQALSIPVQLGSFHKIALKDIRIDYSRRWQQVHLGAFSAAYKSSPYFEFFFEEIARIISSNHEFLIDMNMELIRILINSLRIKTTISYTSHFEPLSSDPSDFRYILTPKKEFKADNRDYCQVFPSDKGFIAGLSIVDLLFNCGPDSPDYL
jgi:hypothetical protein